MGDYHRSRVEAYRAMNLEDSLYTADLGSGDKLYKWQNTAHNSHFVLSDKAADQWDIWRRFQRFKQIVAANEIDKVVLSGYGKPVYLWFTLWLKLKGIRTYMFAESWYPSNALVDAIKGWFLRHFVKGIFVSGQRAEHHFVRRLGFPKDQVTTGYSVVDNAHFQFERSLEDITKAMANTPLLLCVARYAEEKNLALLIEAFEASELASKWHLQIVGGGPLKETLKDKITNPDKVQLLNWQAYNDLPLLYQNATCFILPSRFEPWGLVVNEAMAAALPVILSDACGCLPDLLYDNGYSFKAESKKELIGVLNQLQSCNTAELYKMGLSSAKRISKFTPQHWAISLNKLLC
ncbi:hypothetical protein CA834_07180 [Winogradskyella aurantia]|uniref:Glycosyl transferase family 1 domain-containing protein n=2 Tax=Winogradskyella aurantia TaxID=1915063 RepID=A0A265UV84_9FLAO|nr:hypothetical protein CA834_07180 [Winogradskyella aurantia]